MRRRSVLAALTAVGGAAIAAPLASLEATRQSMAAVVGDLPSSDEWQEIVADYARDFELIGPADLIRELSADLVVLQQTIDADTDRLAGRDLRRVAAQLSAMMGLSLGTLGHHRQARRWWGTAIRTADRSGDSEIGAWVRGKEAVRGLYERRPVEGCLAVVEEYSKVRKTPCTGTMELMSARTQGLSMLNREDEARSVLNAMEEAFATLPTALIEGNAVIGWPEYRLWHTRSYVYTYLGRTTEAYAAQERALAMYSDDLPRQAAMVRLHRARCLIMDGHVADGLVEGSAALDTVGADVRTGPVGELAKAVLATLPSAESRRSGADELRQRLSL